MFSSLRINRLIMVYLKEVICYKASVFLGWDRLAHRIGVKLSVQDYKCLIGFLFFGKAPTSARPLEITEMAERILL